MSTQNIRFFLLASLVLVGFVLFNTWQQEHKSVIPQKTVAASTLSTTVSDEKEIPEIIQNTNQADLPAETITLDGIKVATDLFELTIDPKGGDIVELSLLAFSDEHERPHTHYTLFDQSPKRYYVAQSGLTGELGPDRRGVGRAQYKSSAKHYKLADGDDRLEVELKTKIPEGVEFTKRFVFLRGDYLIKVEYLINNRSASDYKGSFYARLKRKQEPSSSSGFLGMGMGIQTFTGAALNTKDTPYKKFTFKEISEKPYTKEIENGWAAMVEHYFVSAWVPEGGLTYTYQTQVLKDNTYAVGFIAPPITVRAGSQANVEAKLYAGPEVAERLEKVAPGLDLTVDYGMLSPICKPIFWLLKKIDDLIGNWGWSIVIITILIKLLFYKLSAASYRSMGNMRKLQPKMAALKERHGEDKQKFSQAVMELYKKEKVNPLGGCLPVLVQIPVFIALYYVLLGSVELRQAPFIFWIQDLSAKDPYYVLPVLMGITMLIQQKLNPAPPDPVQAKVMMAMPVLFTVLFLNFPSGLVLYWFVSNVLSIVQQWVITRRIELTAGHGAQ
jgi:YidC/Oxa1 family membrane protein insertase